MSPVTMTPARVEASRKSLAIARATRWHLTWEERFDRNYVVDFATGCRLWTGKLGNHGYGRIKVGDKTVLAHRASYERFVGPIPDGYTIDHTCHTADESCPGGTSCQHRRCVNPHHLEPVTLAENKARGRSLPAQNARKTRCPKGHPYDERNTYITREGYRHCHACLRSCEPVEVCQDELCSLPIPSGSRADRRFCSRRCLQRAHRRKAAA